MKIAGIIFYSIFGIISIIHLFACFKENAKLRKYTKTFCMMSLGIATAFFIPNYPLIFVGIFCGMLGDFFLIFDKNKIRYFFIGTAFFLIGHILYGAQIVLLLSYSIPWYVYIVIFGALAILAGLVYPVSVKKNGKLCLIGDFYIPFLFVMLTLSLMFAIDKYSSLNISFIGFLPFIGYLLFIFSDLFLVITKFIKTVKRQNFYIMLTYLLAQLSIVLGLTLMLIK